MEEKDFTFCKFIKENLCFFDIVDFNRNRRMIKFVFEGLDNDAKIFYKWYVYANIFMNEKEKDTIWDYLNNDDVHYELILLDTAKKHKVK